MKEVTIKPRFSETDALGHINNASVAVWFEAGRIEYLESIFDGFDGGMPAWVLASTKIDYLRETFFGADVILKLSMRRVGNASFTIDCAMYQRGEQVVQGEATLVHIDTDTRKSSPLPDAMRAVLQAEVAQAG